MSSHLPFDWDAWLLSAGVEASFTQTSCWARISETVNECAPYALEVKSGGERIGAALFGHRLPTLSTVTQRLKLSLSGLARGRLECLGGPVLRSEDPAKPLGELLSQTDDLARRLGVASVYFTVPPTATWIGRAGIADVFSRFGYRETLWHTALVNLAVPAEQLLAGFRQAARKGIRRCTELRITVRECENSEDYLENFSRPLFATREALGHDHLASHADRHWWDLDPSRQYRYFVAQDDQGQILGTLGTYRWNGVVTEIMSERTMPARKMNLPVQDLLHWEAFLAHRDLGDRLFDLAGFSPNSVDKKELGIRAFKEKWRGRVVSIPRFERTLLSPAYEWIRSVYHRIEGGRNPIAGAVKE